MKKEPISLLLKKNEAKSAIINLYYFQWTIKLNAKLGSGLRLI